MCPQKRRKTARHSNAKMIAIARLFTPTANRRLNELIGFLVLISAAFLSLALISYSPTDPSLNSAASPLATRATHNWIGIFGAITSDLTLQLLGVSAFLVPMFLVLYAARWFRSRPIQSPYAKTFGVLALLLSAAGFVGLLPWEFRWKGAIPAEGLLGRIVADAMIHYLNVIGAYLFCIAMIAVGLYLSTAFSFGALRVWSQTRFAFAYAATDRFADWRAERERKKAAKELEKKRAATNANPVVTAQLVPRRSENPAEKPATARVPVPVPETGAKPRSGIERMFEAEFQNKTAVTSDPASVPKPIAESEPGAPPVEA